MRMLSFLVFVDLCICRLMFLSNVVLSIAACHLLYVDCCLSFVACRMLSCRMSAYDMSPGV